MSAPANRKRLILHVGQHKTGSTYVQKRLIDDRARLATFGILYPAEYISMFGHHLIPDGLMWGMDQSVVDKLGETIAKSFSGSRTVILSSENFCLLKPEALTAIRNEFRGWDISVVYFVRRLSGFWPSHWQELIKHGLYLPFDEYMNKTLQADRDILEYPDQLVQLDMMADVFGYDSLSIIAYDNAMARGQDLYDLFLEKTVGIPMGAPAHRRINASYRPARTEMLRALNMRYADRTGKQAAAKLRDTYLHRGEEFETGAAYEKFCAVVEEWLQDLRLRPDHLAIAAHERALTARFGSRVVNRHRGDRIFPENGPEVVTRYASRYWIHPAGQVAYVDSVLDKLI